MKKKLFALLLTLAMLLPLIPAGSVVHATGEAPEFYGTSLSLESDFAVNFVVDTAALEIKGYSDPRVSFSFRGEDFGVFYPEEKNGYFYFTFRGITPTCLGKPVSATLSAVKDGERVAGEPVEESVLSYCLRAFDSGLVYEDETLCTLIADLLTYGEKSQLYFDCDTGSLVTSGLSQEILSRRTDAVPAPENHKEIIGAAEGEATLFWQGASLRLEDSIKPQFYFDTDDISDLVIEILDENGCFVACYGSDTVERAGEHYRVCCDAVTPDRMQDRLYVTAYDAADYTAISDTLCYSVETYAAEAIRRIHDPALHALLYAMLNYGASAESYVNETRVPSPASTPIYTFDHTPTETEMRAMAVKAMRDELSVQWYTPVEIRFSKDGAAAGEYVYDANRLYGGMPYTSAGIGLFQFLDYYNPNTGRLLYTDSENFNNTIGNTCGSSAVWALFSVCTSLRGLCTSKNLTKANGFFPLGDLDYDDSVTEFNSTNSTKRILQNYSAQKVYQAYAQVKPGDLLVFSDGGDAAGHTMMAIAEAVVSYDSYGNIDPESYIKIQDQRPDLLEDPANTGNDISYFGRRSTRFFFSYLRSQGYLPMTTAEFLGTKAYENAEVCAKHADTNAVPTGNISTKYISSYYLESNYPMALAQFVVNAGTENERVIQTKYFSRTQVNSGTAFHWRMTDFANPVRDALSAAGYAKDGSVPVTVRVTVSNGAVFTPITFIYN